MTVWKKILSYKRRSPFQETPAGEDHGNKKTSPRIITN